MTTATTPKTTFDVFYVSDCEPNPWNKRRELDAAFVESIREKGVLAPGLIRPHPDNDGYQIVCGERRWAASKEADREMWPAVLREMDDQEAQLCTLIENTHREDMTPWQEAQLIGDLLARPDWDIATAAAATGWSESLIRRRAKLLELSPSWKKILEKGEYHNWTTAHFETLTVFSEAQQETFAERFEYDDEVKGATVAELRRELARDTKVLKNAPWDLDDATLCPQAGSCTACPFRTGANADLFTEVDPKILENDRCTDGPCFEKKGDAWLDREEVKAREKHPDLVKLDKDFSGIPNAFHTHNTTPAKKGQAGALPMFVASGKGLGKVEYRKPEKGAEAQVERSQNGGKKTLEEKKAQKERQRDALAIGKLITYIEDAAGELDDHEDAYQVLIQYCLVYGVSASRNNYRMHEHQKQVREYQDKPFEIDAIWESVQADMVRKLEQVRAGLNQSRDPAAKDETVKLCAWMVDADFPAMRKEAKDELPDPASWATADEDKPARKAKRKTELADDGDESADLDNGLDGDSEEGL